MARTRNREAVRQNTMEASYNTQHSHHGGSFTYDKDFVKKRTVADMTDMMCQESTAHGVGHTWNNRRNGLGVFWFLVSILLLASLLYVAVDLCSDFVSREVQSQTTVKINADEGLQLPSVALCNLAFFSRRKLQALGISNILTHYLIASIGPTFVLRSSVSLEREWYKREGHAQLIRHLAKHNITFPELIVELSYTCEEVVLQCVIGSRRHTTAQCCSGFVAVRTMTGLCHVYLTSSADAQIADGEHFGLTFYVNITKDDWPDLDPGFLDSSHTSKIGLQATLTSNHTHPAHLVLGKGAVLQAGVLTTATVTLTRVRDTGMKTLMDLSEDTCVPLAGMKPSTGLQNLLKTEPNCELGAMRSCLHRLCNCTTYSLSIHRDQVPLCVLVNKYHCHGLLHRRVDQYAFLGDQDAPLKPASSIETCLKEGRRTCGRLCERHDFTSATSHLPVPPNLYHHLAKQFSLANGSEMAILTAFYADRRYIEVKMWRKDFLDFFCTLGGYTGLFLGCSIVTFFEVFVYIGLIAAVWFKDFRGRQNPVRPATKIFLKDVH